MDSSNLTELTIQISPSVYDSFLTELDEAGVAYSEIMLFTAKPNFSLIHIIKDSFNPTNLSKLAGAIHSFLLRNQNNIIDIKSEQGAHFKAKGYSAEELKELIPLAMHLLVQNQPESDKTLPKQSTEPLE